MLFCSRSVVVKAAGVENKTTKTAAPSERLTCFRESPSRPYVRLPLQAFPNCYDVATPPKEYRKSPIRNPSSEADGNLAATGLNRTVKCLTQRSKPIFSLPLKTSHARCTADQRVGNSSDTAFDTMLAMRMNKYWMMAGR